MRVAVEIIDPVEMRKQKMFTFYQDTTPTERDIVRATITAMDMELRVLYKGRINQTSGTMNTLDIQIDITDEVIETLRKISNQIPGIIATVVEGDKYIVL